ncbi:hypothetical protein SAMN05421742_10977 [Roseospirillum parvum]|uniref:Uncharacterized protein n=1 Tax=Roseospirillum parvum TaxID=83401 RepID=A0A1G8E9I1_9PROT|nr:hypothetical protein SAMN05421742_10977 [Roseospirillum parvum]
MVTISVGPHDVWSGRPTGNLVRLDYYLPPVEESYYVVVDDGTGSEPDRYRFGYVLPFFSETLHLAVGDEGIIVGGEKGGLTAQTRDYLSCTDDFVYKRLRARLGS